MRTKVGPPIKEALKADSHPKNWEEKRIEPHRKALYHKVNAPKNSHPKKRG
jgi:hypothetical protein